MHIAPRFFLNLKYSGRLPTSLLVIVKQLGHLCVYELAVEASQIALRDSQTTMSQCLADRVDIPTLLSGKVCKGVPRDVERESA